MSKEKLIDLDQDQLDLLHTILKRQIPGKTVWAYGSRVEWKAGETSDLDLAVFGCDPMEIYDLKESLEESDLLISVDVMDWESIPDDFKENIRRKYVVLQERPELEGWQMMKLKDAPLKIIDGDRGRNYPKKADFTSQGYCLFLNTKNVTSAGFKFSEKNFITKEKDLTLREGKLKKNDIVLTTRGTVGNVAFYDEKIPFENIRINSGMVIIRPTGVDGKFNYQLFKYLRRDFVNFASGSAQPQLPIRDLKEISIYLPPLCEQKAIAEVLSSLDDKIDLLHRQNKTLEDMTLALFRKWFGNTKEERWDTGTLSDEFDFTMGQSPPGASYNEEKQGIPLFQGNADFGFRFPTNRVYTTEPKRFAEKFDTLLSVRAPVGEQNMAQERCCIGRGVASFRHKKNKDFYTYTYYKMKSLMNRIKQYDREGTVFGSISKGDFEKLEIILPPYDLVQSFQDKAHAVDEKITVNQSQIQKLENLRDTLLPGLINGKVIVEH